MRFNFYAKDDKGVIPIPEEQISQMNAKRFDIFWTPQEFKEFGKRKIEDLSAIRFLCADFDNVSLPDLISKPFPKPSFIISTRGGFHAYWQLSEFIPASESAVSEYRDFIDQRLISIGADKNAKDVSRLLRVPLMRYWRDSKNNLYDKTEIYTDIVFESDKKYTWEQLDRLFIKPAFVEPEHVTSEVRGPLPPSDADGFWTKANNLPTQVSLEKLSGSQHVNGEVFTFKKKKGLTRIFVNGKPSNAWIAPDSHIGSTVQAGPWVPNWLWYYSRDWKKVCKILKEVFPETL